MKIYADSQDIAERVIKSHGENKMEKFELNPETEKRVLGRMAKIVALNEFDGLNRFAQEYVGKICKITDRHGWVELDNKRACLKYGATLQLLPDKKLKEDKKMSTILCVAHVIANTPCKTGVSNYSIARADFQHPLSGTQRLRELCKRFKLTRYGLGIGYEYSHNRYFPTAAFKRFCKQFIKQRASS